MSTEPSSSRRVVITGMGAICPLGSTLADIAAALAAGKSGVVACETLPSEPAELPLRYAGECRQFTGDIANFGELDKAKKKAIRKALKVMCRETQMAVAAAELAMAHAAFAANDSGGWAIDPERAGVVLGSDYMLTMPEDYSDGIEKCSPLDGDSPGDFDFSRWGETGLGQMTPLWMLKYLPNMPASHIAILNDLRGPNNSLTLREAASNAAIAEAFCTVARGHADIMLAGATGTRILPMQAIHAMQTEELATADCEPHEACRPFDEKRLGMVAGEGAGVLVLEELSHAQARGATIYGEVLGIGSSSVANKHLVGDCQKALANSIRAALRDSGLTPGGIGHINAHGLATHQRDIDESAAIHDALEDAAADIPVAALKSYFGNLGAGSGVVELIGSLISMGEGNLPATLNYHTPAPECNLKVSTGGESPGVNFLNLSVTPQGQASVVAIGVG